LKGDNNTKYFRPVANGRKGKHIIFYLSKWDPTVRGTAELLKLATEYYKSMFGHGEGNAFEVSDSLWQ
jgi:hypothetical protein